MASSEKKRRQRRSVLSEEDYQQKLADVVRRNYFPSLEEAPIEPDEDGTVHSAQHPQEQASSVTAFHEHYTSEDNAEFETNQQKEVEEQRVARNRMLLLTNGPKARETAADTSRRALTAPTPLLLASDQFNAPYQRIHPVDATIPVENSLFFVPSTTQGGQRETGNQRLLMPPPTTSSRAKQTKNHDETSIVQQHNLSSSSDKNKRIEPAATRFPSQQLVVRHPYDDSTARTGDSDSITTTSDITTDIDSVAGDHLSVQRRQGLKRKRREQETLVQMTPQIVPGGAADASPIVTWGTVDATPLILSGTAGVESFQVKGSNRDKAAEAAEQKLQERSRRSRSTKESRKPQRAGSVSLDAGRQSASVSARSRSALGTALRSAYSQSASASSSQTRQRSRRDHAHQATPRVRASATAKDRKKSQSESTTAETASSITEGLLKLGP